MNTKVNKIVVGALEANCYILEDNNVLAIIDPGGDKDAILGAIGGRKAQVKYIINTHYHHDHIDANQAIKAAAMAALLIHENEKQFIDFKADKYLRDNDEIILGGAKLKVILTPGHSAGSFCLLGKDIIFTGDTLFQNGCGRTDLPGGSEAEMEASLQKLKKIIKPGMTVYPGHGKSWVA